MKFFLLLFYFIFLINGFSNDGGEREESVGVVGSGK